MHCIRNCAVLYIAQNSALYTDLHCTIHCTEQCTAHWTQSCLRGMLGVLYLLHIGNCFSYFFCMQQRNKGQLRVVAFHAFTYSVCPLHFQYIACLTNNNPAYKRHWISRPMWIGSPIQVCIVCVLFKVMNKLIFVEKKIKKQKIQTFLSHFF